MAELTGLKVFMVEDEAAVALMIEDMLDELGCSVEASAVRLAQAQEIAETTEVDFAILDVNLAGQPVFPVAEVLSRRQIPFVFSSGYGPGGLPSEYSGRPVLSKPYSLYELERAINALLPG